MSLMLEISSLCGARMERSVSHGISYFIVYVYSTLLNDTVFNLCCSSMIMPTKCGMALWESEFTYFHAVWLICEAFWLVITRVVGKHSLIVWKVILSWYAWCQLLNYCVKLKDALLECGI